MVIKGGLLDKLNENTEARTERIPSEIITDGIPSLLSMLRLGTPNQKHDAAKAIGYIGKLGQMPADLKIEASNILVDILQNEYPTMTIAFAMAEALMRVNDDAFWTLVMTWYGQSNRSITNPVKSRKVSS